MNPSNDRMIDRSYGRTLISYGRTGSLTRTADAEAHGFDLQRMVSELAPIAILAMTVFSPESPQIAPDWSPSG